MKKSMVRLVVLLVPVVAICISVFMSKNVAADDFGCKVLLCLASPGGAMQYEECRPTIRKLYRMLYKRKPFPSCEMANSEGISVKQGVEPWVECKEGYESASEQQEGEYYRQARVCRIFLGYKEVIVWEDRGGKRIEKVPVYDTYLQQRRSEPFYVEVHLQGYPAGQRFYYKKKSKKKGWF